MKLKELVRTIPSETPIWISADASISEGLYFGQAQEVPEELLAKSYDVASVYPERYSALYGFTGISIIVEQPWHGITRWCADDVIGVAKSVGREMSVAQAENWWTANEKAFKNTMVEAGNELLETMLQ